MRNVRVRVEDISGVRVVLLDAARLLLTVDEADRALIPDEVVEAADGLRASFRLMGVELRGER